MTDETTTTETEAPAGFRRVRFAAPDAPETIHEGIVRIGAETWSGGLMPFVSVETAKAIAGEWREVFPTPKAAHAEGVGWFEVDQLFSGYEFVVFEYPGNERLASTEYDEHGYPVDSDAWGTSNLEDDAEYAKRHPGSDWLDLGALGLVWEEVADN